MYFVRFIFRRILLVLFLWKKHFWRSLFSSVGLLITLIIASVILATVRPMKRMIAQKMENSLPGETIRVTSKKKINFLENISLFGEKPDLKLGIDKKIIKKIASWKEVKKVGSTQILQKSAMATLRHPLLSAIGGGLSFDVLIQGIDRTSIRPYLKCMRKFKSTRDIENDIDIVPLIVPETYAEILYSYAMVNGLPPIDLKELTGMNLKIMLGKSVLGLTEKEIIEINGKICGFVPQGFVTTVGAPITWVKKFNLSQKLTNAASSYDQLFVTVKNYKDISQVKKRLRKLNLKITARKSKNYSELLSWLNKLDLVFWALAAILLLLSAIAMINAFALLTIEKKYEFGLYLVFGASPLFIWIMIVFEGAFWGAFHSILGIKLAQIVVDYLGRNLGQVSAFVSLFDSALKQIQFELSLSEKIYLISASIIFGAISSLLPAIFLMAKKTLNLVKKD